MSDIQREGAGRRRTDEECVLHENRLDDMDAELHKQSGSIENKTMKILYAYHTTEPDFLSIANHGFDTVIGGFSFEQLDQMQKLGLSCIHTEKTVHPAIVGYYLYDEPDLWTVPIAEQDAKIAEYRKFTSLPLSIAIVENMTYKCSQNFDLYLLDIYYGTAMYKITNYLNATFSSMFAQILYKKVVPIMGVFTNPEYQYTPEILPFARYFRKWFPSDDQAIFVWSVDGQPEYKGIIDVPIFSGWTKLLNSTTDHAWGITRGLVYGLSWLAVKIRNLW